MRILGISQVRNDDVLGLFKLVLCNFTGKECSTAHGRQKAFSAFAYAVLYKGDLSPRMVFLDMPSRVNQTDCLLRIVQAEEFFVQASPPTERGIKHRLYNRPQSQIRYQQSRDELQMELSKRPAALFPDSRSAATVNSRFSRFQIGVIGREGSGKSSTLNWLAFYSGMPPNFRNTFSVASQHGQSHTRALFKRGFCASQDNCAFVAWDTTGLDGGMDDMKAGGRGESYVDVDVVQLTKGMYKERCQFQWGKPFESPQLSSFAQSILGVAYSVFVAASTVHSMVLLALVILPLVACLIQGPRGTLWILVAIYLLWLLSPGAIDTQDDMCAGAIDLATTPRREFHAVLFVTKYFDLDSSDNAADLRALKLFVRKLRRTVSKQGISVVCAVTDFGQCRNANITACASRFRDFLELGKTDLVALDDTNYLPSYTCNASNFRNQQCAHDVYKETGVYVEPDRFVQLVKQLQYAAMSYYEHSQALYA